MKAILAPLILALTLATHASAQTPKAKPDHVTMNNGITYQMPNVTLSQFGIDSEQVTSAFARVKAYRRYITLDEFKAGLQRGENYAAPFLSAPLKCDACHGFKRVSDNKSKAPDRKSPCPTCKGSGVTVTKSWVLYSWN